VAAVLLLSATAALSLQTALSFQDLPPVEIAVDLNTAGNEGKTLGAVDSCLSVNQGDSFDVDVTVRGIPPMSSNFEFGLAGFGINLNFDPNVIHSTAVNSKQIIQSASTFEFKAANYVFGGDANDFPGTSGDTRYDLVDLGKQDAFGDGVLARFTFQAVGSGSTTLTLDSQLEGTPYPVTFGRIGNDLLIYPVSLLHNGRITVGQPCTDPPAPIENPATPTSTEVPGPTFTPGSTASRAPTGDTQLAIDTVITGNEATKLGHTDECARANEGDTFQVDVVIKGVKDLLAWELPISLDPQVLRVVDRDVKLFLQANQGSQVLDASNQTPDSTGVYVASAFDSADPVAPDSGEGVLVRLKLQALKTGTSKLSLKPADINGDTITDRGVLLRNVDSAIIGDTNDDTFFDGPTSDAEIRVGADCATSGHVVTTGGGNAGGDDGSDSWILVAIGAAVVAIVASAGAGFMLLRRRSRTTTPS